MSRSRRRTPIIGNCACRSERSDKKDWHGRMRARTRLAILRMDENMPEVREVSDPWTFGKDGKQWFEGDKKYMRK